MVNKSLLPHYHIPDPLPWAALAAPIAAAEDQLARFDERLGTSPIQPGVISRSHFTDACACLWLEGELVHIEDLVLHDAGMDIRAPTHELTRAHTVLRYRRRIAEAAPGWALSPNGLDSLSGAAGRLLTTQGSAVNRDTVDGAGAMAPEESGTGAGQGEGEASHGTIKPGDDLAGLFATIDAAIASAERTLAGEEQARDKRPARAPLIYDPDWDEGSRLAAWRTIVEQTHTLPPVLAAAIAADAWAAIAPLQHMPWLGRLLAASLLRMRGKVRSHLIGLHHGLKTLPRQRRHHRDGLLLEIETMTAAAHAGLKDHDRWLTAHNLLVRKLAGRRSTSHLPDLINYVMAKPIVSAGMIAAALKISQRAAQNLITELGIRELTGRGRYRAWGII